jgi:hypothetical protein
MNKNMAIILLPVALGIFGLARISLAADHHVRDGGTGSGESWSDALDDLPSDLVRGDTYYVADGSYGSCSLDDEVSGSDYIHVKKATVSDHGTSTGWSDSYADGQAVFSTTGGTTVEEVIAI